MNEINYEMMKSYMQQFVNKSSEFELLEIHGRVLSLVHRCQDGTLWMDTFFPPNTVEEAEINEYTFTEQISLWSKMFDVPLPPWYGDNYEKAK